MSYFPSTQITENTEALRYAASGGFVTPAAATTDLFTFTGSGTKVVYIDRIELGYSGDYGALNGTQVFLVKRSTAGSGGTSTTATSVPLDSNSSAATATGLKSFTVNPTVGTLVGNIKTGVVMPNSSNGGASLSVFGTIPLFDAVANHGPIVLRSTSEQIAINFNGVIPGATTPRLSCTVFWRER